MSVLHIFNGDSAAGSFHSVEPDADVLVSRDAVCAGPAPARFDERWIETRSAFLSSAYGAEPGACRDDLARFEAAFAAAQDRYDEIVLWYGHDLFCLVVMLSHGARLATAGRRRAALSLVCPDGSTRDPAFRCLGDLASPSLAALLDERVELDDDWLAAATTAWMAYTSPDPTVLNDRPRAPRMRRALALHAARFPDTRTGLGCVEEQVLRRLEDGGDGAFAEIFRDHGTTLPDYGWGDAQLAADLKQLVDRPRPLLVVTDGVFSITDHGRAALAGDTAVGLGEGASTSLGGVELAAGHPWRYDAERDAVIRVS